MVTPRSGENVQFLQLEGIQILWLLLVAEKKRAFAAGGNSDVVAAPHSGENLEFLQLEGIQM